MAFRPEKKIQAQIYTMTDDYSLFVQ